jgi:hypothetical protein
MLLVEDLEFFLVDNKGILCGPSRILGTANKRDNMQWDFLFFQLLASAEKRKHAAVSWFACAAFLQKVQC